MTKLQITGQRLIPRAPFQHREWRVPPAASRAMDRPRAMADSTVRLDRLDPGAEDLGDAPRLRDAASRREGGLRVEDLADRTQARFVEMRAEPLEKPSSTRPVLGVDLEPGV